MADWKPELYLKFKKERTQPVYDLMGRIEIETPHRILDIGCGPGNSTAVLVERFPNAEIIGIDLSPAMIERAKNECHGASFFVGDAGGDLSKFGTFDLVSANAFLQWMPDHAGLLTKLFAMLNLGGAVAMQVPQFDRMPIARVFNDVASSPNFGDFFVGFDSGMHYFSDDFYYDTLSALSREVCIWSTEYFHVMENHEALIDWTSSTSMKPYTEQLPNERREEFTAKVLEELKASYKAQKDGKVLFPFKRLFFIAYK